MVRRARGCRGARPWLVVAVMWAISLGAVQAQDFDLSVPAAMLMEANTGQVLFAKNVDEPFQPASLSKIVTILTVMEAVAAGEMTLDDPVRTSQRASSIGGSQVYLTAGETHSLEAMLKAVAIAGANDASVAVAEYVSGTEAAFLHRMSNVIDQLEMRNSAFGNVHGLPPAAGEDPSWTSARDIAAASRALIVRHPVVLTWTVTRVETFREEPLFNLYNTNDLIGWYDGLDGLRGGFTSEAGYHLVATAQRGNTRLISVVMGAPTAEARNAATRSLLDYGFNRFQSMSLGSGVVGRVNVPDGDPDSVDVSVAAPVNVLVPRSGGQTVRAVVEPSPQLAAPISTGDEVGQYVVYAGDVELLRIPAYANGEVARAGFFTRIWRGIVGWFGGLF